jgi:glycosyltransferase involved in cell wall biosynthesis
LNDDDIGSSHRSPTVSVVMAAFNAERFIGEAIASVLEQQFRDFELLIVNDGSTDSTRDIVRACPDPRLRLIDNGENIGLTRSLNHALTQARGTYIARQDADDVSAPQRLGAQVAFLDARPDVALVGSWFSSIDAHGAVVRQTALPVRHLDIRWAMFFFCPFVHSAVMWRRELVHAHIGSYNDTFSYAQDHELWARIACRFAVANLPQFLVRYREHPQSMTETACSRAFGFSAITALIVGRACRRQRSGRDSSR